MRLSGVLVFCTLGVFAGYIGDHHVAVVALALSYCVPPLISMVAGLVLQKQVSLWGNVGFDT